MKTKSSNPARAAGKLLSSAYKGKRVLVTGHTGFKGGWLATWLKMLGSRVTGFALPAEPATPSFYESARVAEGMNSVIDDIRDFDALRRIFKETAPEIVFHNAAQALVRRSYRDPVETYATNVMGTVHVLEAARQTASVRAVVIVTSDKCYENREWVWGYRENDPMGGFDPYSSSKGCAELVTAAYRQSFFSAAGGKSRQSALIASARAGNVIGGGDWSEDRLIPDLVRGIINGAKIPMRNPGALRPWQHVLDPLYGYLLLGRRLLRGENDFAEPWNFGPHQASIPVSELAGRFLQFWGKAKGKARLASAAGPQPHEAHHLKLDCSKAQVRLGWEPRLGADEMLRWTADWYRDTVRDPRCAQQLTCRQITQYMDLAL